MDAIGKRQQVPYRLKCKYRLRSVGFSKEKYFMLSHGVTGFFSFL